MAVTDVVFSPTGLEVPTTQLYQEFVNFFELEAEVQGVPVIVDIAEPIDWNKVRLVHRRSAAYHGFSTEMLTAEVELSFNCEAGSSFIRDRYETDGSDAEIIFRTGVIIDGQKFAEFESKLDLNVYRRVPGKVTCVAIRKSIADVFSTRNDTQLEFLEAKDLDNNTIPPFVPDQISLHSQAIVEKYVVEIKEKQETYLSKQKDGDLWFQFPMDAPTTDQIKEAYNPILGVSELDPIANDRSFIKFQGGGRVDVSLHYAFNWGFKITPKRVTVGSANITFYELQVFLAHRNASGQVKYYPAGSAIQGSNAGREVNMNCIFKDFNTTLQVKAGDELFLYARWKFEHNKNELKTSEAWVTIWDFGLTLTAKTETASSICQGFLIGRVLDRACLKMTGSSTLFKSSFYQQAGGDNPTDGCGSSRIITSGTLLRQTPLDKSKMPISWKDIIDSVVAIDGVGYGWEYDPATGEKVRVERREYFYQDNELLLVEFPGEIKLEVAKEYLPNRITLGYNKYQDEKETQLDEIHGEHEYSTPIRTNKLDLNLQSRLIASGILIELTRRAKWTPESTDSSTYDDEPFIIDVTGAVNYAAHMIFVPEIFTGNGWEQADTSRIIQVESMDYAFGPNQTVVFSGVGPNSGIYQIAQVGVLSNADGQYGWLLTVDKILTPYQGDGEFYIPGTTLQALRDEPFSSVYGMVDPSSAYNMLLTPKRMLLANASWIAGLGAYKPSDRPFKATRIRYNANMRSTLKDGWPCDRGDFARVELEEGKDIELVRLGDPIFVPEWITFKCKLKYQQVRRLFNALRGLDPVNNYGYIRVIDENGEPLTGWPYEIEFNPTKGDATFKLLRRFEPPTLDLDQVCTDFANYNFDDWAAKYPGFAIERCRYNNFD